MYTLKTIKRYMLYICIFCVCTLNLCICFYLGSLTLTVILLGFYVLGFGRICSFCRMPDIRHALPVMPEYQVFSCWIPNIWPDNMALPDSGPTLICTIVHKVMPTKFRQFCKTGWTKKAYSKHYDANSFI